MARTTDVDIKHLTDILQKACENTDVVLWYTFGHTHIPRPEDYPVMPTAYIGFTLKPNGYQVSQALRECIVFAPHNLIRDAPFTKLDLITCRNLLIYFQPHAQKTVLSLFHFSLKPGGFLFMGSSESPGTLIDEFDTIDEQAKIYRKRRDIGLPRDLKLPLPRSGTMPRKLPPPQRSPAISAPLLAAYDRLLDRFMPPSFLVDEHGQLVDLAWAVVDAGADALMVNALALGLDGLQTLAESAPAVPILAHTAGVEIFTGGGSSGFGQAVLLGRLLPLAGADAVLTSAPTAFTQSSTTASSFLASCDWLTSCWYCPTPMLLGSIFTSSASGSCSLRAIETAPRRLTSSSGNSAAANADRPRDRAGPRR